MKRALYLLSFLIFPFLTHTLQAGNTEERKLALVDFTVVQNGNKADVKWSMNREPLGHYFTIEKSTDRKNFTKVIDMPVTENGNIYEEYMETDYQPFKGISYYRIRQTDEDGNVYYSDIITAKFTDEQSKFVGLAVPKNEPAIDAALKSIENTQNLYVLRDTDGNDFYSRIALGKEDNYLVVLQAYPQMAPGIYRIVGTTNNQLYSLKVVIK